MVRRSSNLANETLSFVKIDLATSNKAEASGVPGPQGTFPPSLQTPDWRILTCPLMGSKNFILTHYHLCSSWLSVAVIIAMTKGAWPGKGLFQLTGDCPSLRKVKAGTQYMSLKKQESWRNTDYWFVSSAFIRHLPRDATTHSGLALPTPISNPGLAPRAVLTGLPEGGLRFPP